LTFFLIKIQINELEIFRNYFALAKANLFFNAETGRRRVFKFSEKKFSAPLRLRVEKYTKFSFAE